MFSRAALLLSTLGLLATPGNCVPYRERGSWETSTTTTAAAAVVEPATATTVDIDIDAAVYAAAATVASAPAIASRSSSNTNPGAKRGVSYNDASSANLFSSSAKISWAYNWASSTTGLFSGWEFVPMLWGAGPQYTADWAANVSASIKSSGSKHLLAFNEPDLEGQANIAAVDAANAYMAHVSGPYGGRDGLRLGAPAVSSSAVAGQGLDWLFAFLGACAGRGCQIDFVPIHYYADDNATAFREYVALAHALVQRPIWITEFQFPHQPPHVQKAFIDSLLPWLDEQDFVERYAYFGVTDGSLVAGNALTVAGTAYAS